MPADSPPVVLLHGLGLGGWAMARLAASLRRRGHRVINLSYPSQTVPLEVLAQDWLPDQLRRHHATPSPRARINFVTHSMGGLLLRAWLDLQPALLAVHRVVMIAPPNHGSRLVDRTRHWPLFSLATGVNGKRLGTGPDQLPAQLPAWPHPGPELGIIAGNAPFNPCFAHLTGGPGDGKVTVESTKLVGMTDHLILPHSHTLLQYRAEPIRQVHAFLADGRFKR